MPASIQSTLSGTSLPLDRMTHTYAPFLSLTSRILGAPPHFLALADASPLTHIFYLGALRSCFRLPECDLNLLRITPAMRRTALLESSINHHCAYCTGHVAAMGDVVKGSMVMQCARRGDMALATDQGEAIIRMLVAEVCSFPGVITAETKRQFVDMYGEEGYTLIASMIAFMGWLNFTMGASGMRLESRMAPFAVAATKNRILPFDIRKSVKDDHQEDVGNAEVANVRRKGLWGMLVEHIRNAWGLLALIGPVATAGLAEKKWFSGIPQSVHDLDQWCERTLGVNLDVFKGVTDPVLKRSFALGLRLVYVHDDPLWTRQHKSLFLYVLATGIMDDRLKEDALKLYPGNAQDATKALLVAKSADDPTNAFEAGLKYMHACAGYADNVSEEILDWLMKHVKTNRSIVDLAGMVGHFGFWHRASVLYPGN